MKKARKKYMESCEISEVVTVDLGGYPQKIAIEGKNRSLPVVICLHGGPGSPVPFGVGCRGLFPEWTDKAIMIYWDQLGCGVNNYPIDDSFSIDTFADMTCELVKELKTRFSQNKLYLFGMSWGSILALKAALRLPEYLSGAFVYGQFLENNFFSEEVVRAFDGAPERVQEQIVGIVATGADCEYKVLDKNLQKLYRYLSKYTDAYTNKKAKPAPVGKIVKGLFTSPDYSFRDFKAVMKNGYRNNQSLWRELVNIHLSSALKELKIPYLIIQGDTDLVTSTRLVTNAVQKSDNANVSVKVVKNAGHMPSAEAMIEIFKDLSEWIA